MKKQESATAQCSLPDVRVNVAPTLLIVGPVEDDLGRDPVFDQLGWPALRVRHCLDVALNLHGSHPCVVVCERDLADGGWKDVLEVTASRSNPPPLIVTSRLADEYLWAEVLNLGGFDVLAKPLNKQEVRRVLNFAWEHWADQAYRAERPKAAPARKGDLAKCSAA
jgi:FixJ family two-component response regulator